ncbi:TPA: lipopolysaccharide biosynthesis protein [Vibrio alginolyticus]|uniref:lipopolysaccharide biosynthesis protein n=1 Tax=Vibrio alginolyticus TaxID=663 RepID=UPI002277BD4A|nr:hypothetical protein [Vibrio alginolyticus]WAE56212.1 hypothetical protein OPR71_14410 [Vibrio alginolyticus]
MTTSIFRNAKYAYFKLGFNIVAGLLIIRWLYISFGHVGFGVFALINSIVLSMTFLNSAMTTSFQRAISYSIGRGKDVKPIVSSAFLISFILATLIILLLYVAFFPLQEFVINVPDSEFERFESAFNVSILSVFILVLTIPLNSLMIAKEDLWLLSLFDIFATSAKLLFTYYIYIHGFDYLTYFIYLACLEFMMSCTKFMTLVTRYKSSIPEVKAVRVSSVKEISKFVGWNSFGALSGVIRTHGFNISINSFFGVSTNSVYSIAMQLNNQLRNLPNVLMQVFSPRIVRLEGENEREKMLEAALLTCKICSLMYFSVAFPFLVIMKDIVNIWLGDVPSELFSYTLFLIILSGINVITVGFQVAIQAIGDVKKYQIVVASTNIISLPIGLILFSIGYPAYSIIISAILMELVASYFRVYFVSKLNSDLDINFWSKVGFRLLILIALLISCVAYIEYGGYLNIIYIKVFSGILIPLLVLSYGVLFLFTKREMSYLIKVIFKKLV